MDAVSQLQQNAIAVQADVIGRVGVIRLAGYLDRFIFCILLAVIVLTAIPYGTVEPWWKAVFQCAVFALALLWIIEGTLSGRWLVRQHRLLIPLVALVVFILIQAILPLRSPLPGSDLGAGSRPISYAPYSTKMAAFQLVALVVTGGLLLRYTTTRRRLMALVYVVVGVGLGSTLFGLLRRAFQQKAGFVLPYLPFDDGTISRGVGFAQFINHNHFAFVVEMSLGLVLGLMLRRPLRATRVFGGLVVSIPMWTAIVYSGSRGGLATMMGQVLFVALLVFVASPGRDLLLQENKHERVNRLGPFLVTRLILIASFVVVMVLGVVWVGGDPLASNLDAIPNEFGVKDSDKYSRTYRSKIWPMTWQMIKDHPFAGVGFGGYWIGITKYHQGSGEYTPQQAHNDYLELLASGGIIGVALAGWFVVIFLRKSGERLRAPDPICRAACLGALTGIFGVAFHSFVDFGLHVTINAALFMTLLVIATLTVSPAAQSMRSTRESARLHQ